MALLLVVSVPAFAQVSARSLMIRYNLNGHLIAPVSINDKGPFAFIVDTAASRTIITSDLAATLSLEPLDNHLGQLASAGGASTTDVFRLGVLKLARQEWTIGPVLVLPENAGQTGFSGVLGLDVLAGQPLLFNFKAMRLSLLGRTQARFLRRQRGWHKIIARRNFAGFLVVKLQVNGRTVKAIIDTGARRTIGNARLGALLDDLSPASIMARDQIITGVTLPRVPARTGQARGVNLQGLRWYNTEILVSDLAIFDTLGFGDQPALILGMDFLQSTSSIMVDFSRERLWIKP